MIHQRSASLIKRLTPPTEVNTEPEKYLAQSAAARKIILFDIAIAIVILIDFVLTFIDSVTKWWYVVSPVSRIAEQS